MSLITEAREKLASLRRRAINGDPDVTTADLVEAQAGIDLAEMQHEGHTRRAAAKKAAVEAQARAEAIDAAQGLVTTEKADYAAARTAAADALRGYLAAVDELNGAILDAGNLLSGAAASSDTSPRVEGGRSEHYDAANHALYSAGDYSMPASIVIDGTSYQPKHAGGDLLDLLREVAGQVELPGGQTLDGRLARQG